MADEPVAEILAAWGLAGARVEPAPGGHINRSWIVGPGRYFLQRINPAVFPRGDLVLENVANVSEHLQAAVRRLGVPDPDRRVLRVVRTGDGRPGVVDPAGVAWRLLHFIGDAVAHQRAGTWELAAAAGAAFGRFQRLVADYAGPPLAETIPGFHDAARRLEQLERAAHRDAVRRAGNLPNELRFARSRAAYAGVLPPLLDRGEVPRRVVHNDAKIANLLFDRGSGEPLAVVDLDTVMPGTLLSDVGDLIRSCATLAAEDERDPDAITVSIPRVEALLRGFLGESGGVLTAAERAHLVFAGILLTWEQGVRFLTDHLEGDRYYRITRPDQNLDRARAQFRLVECLEQARGALERLVGALPG